MDHYERTLLSPLSEIHLQRIGINLYWTLNIKEQPMAQCAAHMDFDAGVGYVSMLAVRGRWRGKGVGTMLLRRAIYKMALCGMDLVTLDDHSDRYRAEPNIYTMMGFKYVDPEEGPEMHGVIDDLIPGCDRLIRRLYFSKLKQSG